jgi:pimeloyl-ACP methyl ester carboxylesterase
MQPIQAAPVGEKREPLQVYFLTGGPIDVFSHDTVRKIKEKTLDSGKVLNIPVRFEQRWFTRWRSVSKKIQAEHGRGKVVLIGHSWGAAAAAQIAKDLDKKNIPVDLLVTIDTVSIAGISNPSAIPTNVRVNYNFYQTSDVFFHAHQRNQRQGTTDLAGIHNVKILLGLTYSPHLKIDNKVEPLVSSQIKLLMLGRLDQLDLPEQLDKKLLADSAATLEATTTY